MNFYRRFTSLRSASARVILRENSLRGHEALLPATQRPSLVVKILSINRSHSSLVLHRYRSPVVSLCNTSRFGPSKTQVKLQSSFLRKPARQPGSATSVKFAPRFLGNPCLFPSFSPFSTRLISTFHRTGMMVWASEYDFDPKVTNCVTQRMFLPPQCCV